MSYLVLARKYRPANFKELEGQEHVLQALVNALTHNRLHHAYLFTGTRGVGKTTIARILAKCLNCETGVTAEPCGTCDSCVSIVEGRSVDLIEVDAASRTGVDDMRELLDNVQYMPSVSRFKIYLIDEVHMLSKSSFNAMLKTLEEPPEHVKFLFATTDPKKLPVTVLSRCLQFNLKNLSPEQVKRYLAQVLDAESITYEEDALWQLGHAADGSMRDALSLTDQAISFGDNAVAAADVKKMLGAIDREEVFALLDAVLGEDGETLLQRIAALSEFAPDYEGMLNDLLSVLHRLAIAKSVPNALDNSMGDRERVVALAERCDAPQVQLLYQIGLLGQRDLQFAPSPRVGFEMALLRMMSFAPVPPDAQVASGGPGGESQSSDGEAAASAPAGKEPSGKEAPIEETSVERTSVERTSVERASVEQASVEQVPVERVPVERVPVEQVPAERAPADESASAARSSQQSQESQQPQPQASSQQPSASAAALQDMTWPELLAALKLEGTDRLLASNCTMKSLQNGVCTLTLDKGNEIYHREAAVQAIAAALTEHCGEEVTVSIEIGRIEGETPAQRGERQRQEATAQAIQSAEADTRVQRLIERFNGKLDPDSLAGPQTTGGA